MKKNSTISISYNIHINTGDGRFFSSTQFISQGTKVSHIIDSIRRSIRDVKKLYGS